MNTRPILFSAPMVRAMLREAQPKTQTRRTRGLSHLNSKARLVSFNPETGTALFRSGKHAAWSVTCPYGVAGDRLWCREACWIYGIWHEHGATSNGRKRWRFETIGERVLHTKPDDEGQPIAYWGGGEGFTFRPSIHMPRWASRITVELTDVRVERLQSITEEDARAEGVEIGQETPVRLIVKERGKVVRSSRGVLHDFTYRGAFCRAWDGMHGNGSWDADPWVWVLSFRRVQQAQEAANGR